MMDTEKFYKVVDYIDRDMDRADILEIWNQLVCEDDYVYPMDEFDMMYDGLSPLRIAALVRNEDFCENDGYFRETMYGVESGDLWDMVDDGTMAEYIVEHDDDFGYPAIREILESEDE